MVQSSKSKVGRCSIFALFSHKRESAVEGCTDFAYLGNRPNAYNCCQERRNSIISGEATSNIANFFALFPQKISLSASDFR